MSHQQMQMSVPAQVLFAFFVLIFSALPVAAQSPTSSAEKYRICSALRMANQDGISGKYMLEEMLAGRGQPKYLANVIMRDVKPMCPNVY
jgi:hypothetical protein